jgi:hypothetical protein
VKSVNASETFVSANSAAKKSGLCPQPDCKMDFNCAPSYDCCVIGGSKFCVPSMLEEFFSDQLTTSKRLLIF